MNKLGQFGIADLLPLKNTEIERFFGRCVDEVAADLIGMYLFNEIDGVFVGGKIIETEAYCQNDPAAHCHPENDSRFKKEFKQKVCLFEQGIRQKKVSSRMHDSMFKSAGHVYIYDKKHYHLNFVCGVENFGSAVLIRALMPILGNGRMFNYRSKPMNKSDGDETYLCNGPNNLCEAIRVTHEYDGKLIFETPLRLYKPKSGDNIAVLCGPRVLGKLIPSKPRPWHAAVDWPRSYTLAEDSVKKLLSPNAKCKIRSPYNRESLRKLKTCGLLASCNCR